LKKLKNIYLISPNKIKEDNFYKNLNLILKTNKVNFFQLRLKNENFNKVIKIGKKIKKICKKHKVKFIVNDNPILANKIEADGCHLGQSDMNILKARKILKRKIIGVTCHNSRKLIRKAIKNKADYLAIGAFYKTSTKKVKYKAKIVDLVYAKKITSIPIVVIGGINSKNYKKLLLNKANFLAISSYIWKNKKLNPVKAIRTIK